MSIAIQVDHLAYQYPGVDNTPGIAVFEDLNFTIDEGSFVAIIGANGCGKTTLFKMILENDSGDGGDIFLPKSTI